MSTQRPFLLLDPPSGNEFFRRASLREKDGAVRAPFPSIDLVLLSGAVREAGFRPMFLDAQINRLSWRAVAEQARSHDVAGVLSLTSSAQLHPELAALAELKTSLGNVPTYTVGNIINLKSSGGAPKLLEQYPWLDGVVLNTAENNLTEVLASRSTGEDARACRSPFNIALRRGEEVIVPENRVRYGESLHIPRPEHSIFQDLRYFFPQSKRGPVTCSQFSFGCPFTCEFCIDNQLYRNMLYRDVDDMVTEMVEIDRLGFREVYFKDLTFGLNKGVTREFLEKLVAARLRLRWLCTSRVDVMTPETLALMKRAGCYGIEFGVEHANEVTRRRIDKRISDTRIRDVFAQCRRARIEATAFIMLAFEDDTEEDVRATIRFAQSLRPSYVSFNVVNALPGTAYEERARREGFLREGEGDYAFTSSNIKHRHLTPTKIAELRREAVRSFYFQPSAILDRLLQLRSFFELRKLVRLGLGAI